MIWTNAQLFWSFGMYFSEICFKIKIFTKMYLRMSSAKCWLSYFTINVLKQLLRHDYKFNGHSINPLYHNLQKYKNIFAIFYHSLRLRWCRYLKALKSLNPYIPDIIFLMQQCSTHRKWKWILNSKTNLNKSLNKHFSKTLPISFTEVTYMK